MADLYILGGFGDHRDYNDVCTKTLAHWHHSTSAFNYISQNFYKVNSGFLEALQILEFICF